MNDPSLSGPDNGIGDGIGDTGSLSDLSGYPDTGLDSGTGTGDGVGDVGDLSGLDASADPTAFPGDLSDLGDTGLDPSALDGTGLGDLGLDGLDPSAIDSALNPSPSPDSAAWPVSAPAVWGPRGRVPSAACPRPTRPPSVTPGSATASPTASPADWTAASARACPPDRSHPHS